MPQIDECGCICHEDGQVETIHAVACCKKCPKCQRRIRAGLFEQHQKECKIGGRHQRRSLSELPPY